MALLKKVQILVVILSLVLTICFPPKTKVAKAAVSDNDIGFVVWVDEIRGTTGLLDLIGAGVGAIVGNVDITFKNTRVTGLVMSKTVNTEHGELLVTIKSRIPNHTLNLGTLRLKAKQLSFGRITKLPIPVISPEAGLGDIHAIGEIVESSSIQIPELIVETTFNKNEINRIKSLQAQLKEDIKIEDNLEEMLLAIDEATKGPLSKQNEAYEALLNEIPILQNDVEQIDKLIKENLEKQNAIEQQLASLMALLQEAEQLIEQPEMNATYEKIKKGYTNVLAEIDNFIASTEHIAHLIETIRNKLDKHAELLNKRLEYVKELGLDGWSKTYHELIETHNALQKIKSKLDGYVKQLLTFTSKTDEFYKRLESITLVLNRLEINANEQTEEQQVKEKNIQLSKEKLNELLEQGIENEKLEETDVIIDDDSDESEEKTLDQLQEEFEQWIREIKEQAEQWPEDEYADREKELLPAIKEELARYAKQFIQYAEELNEQLNEMETNEELTEEAKEQLMELEEQLISIKEIIARIEEMEDELSQLLR